MSFVYTDENQTGEIPIETLTEKSTCNTKQGKNCKLVGEGLNHEETSEQSHVKETNRVHSPTPFTHNSLALTPPTCCSESIGKTETDCIGNTEICGNNCDENCGNIDENLDDRTKYSDDVAGKDNVDKKKELTRKGQSNKKKYAKNDKIYVEKDKSDKADAEFASPVHVDGDREIVNANKIVPDLTQNKYADSFSNCDNTFNCGGSEGDDTIICDSLDVNFDSGSVNTISDDGDEYLCTQYSESDLLKDSETVGEDHNTNDFLKPYANETRAINEIDQNNENKNDGDDDSANETAVNENVPRDDKVKDINYELGASEFKILKYFQKGSLVKDRTESDFSGFESFYSLDNSGTATALGTPVVKRLKKTLTWTPRILSEERFSSSRSTTLSSDVASFYTADTYGTFYSACSFQIDSCDDFVTCEDFQKLEFNEEPKSKLSKAKDVLVKGRDFVKSKIECYRKRLPSLSKGNRDIKSRILCRNSCGFSCVQVGKEISLYSIPDTSTNSKGVNDTEIKGGNKINNSVENEANEGTTCNVGMSSDFGGGMTVRKRLEEKNGLDDTDERHGGRQNAFDRQNGEFDGRKHKGRDKREINGKGNDMSRSDDQEREERMESVSREATEENEDDLPVGTEATTINLQRRTKDTSESEESRSKKRLRWVSAIERTQGTSLTSSLTTNSSVDQLLDQREMDPELLLSSLGFGAGPQADDTLSRVPDRFLLTQSSAGGVDQYQLVMNHPELHHLLPVMGTSQLKQGASQMIPENSPVTTENKQDVVDSGARNQQPRKGSMQRPSFSTVAHGMKFIRGASMQAPPSPDEETKKIGSIQSVLDFPNRKALARQGFYGMEFASKEMKEHADAKAMKRSSSAAEKRKKFHHSSKSRGNWSFTDESEEGSSPGRHETTTSEDSWDRGLVLQSFSDRFSSESSVESADSYSEERRELRKQNSISNLRRQYEETIMKSMDGEYPVFPEDENGSFENSENGRKLSVSEIRKQQVDRLMCSFDDDGDYTAQSRTLTLRELDPKSALILAQKSTQSTLTGSPLTPKDMTFSFEQGLNDGEEEFNFTATERSGKLSQQNKQSVSIIIEEEVTPRESTQTREVNQKQNSNELTSLTLGLRSDSCNTLVPQDSNIDSEAIDGELTPRAGDALSESASSSATLSTVIYDQLDADLFDQDERSRAQDGRSDDTYMRSRSLNDKNSLKPAPYPPQESFELEEISSAENAFEDWNGNIGKSSVRRGPLEKSASTHSDSSGFADLDTAGEPTLSSIEISKEHLLTHQRIAESSYQTDSKSKSSLLSHDTDFTHNALQSHPAGAQKRFTKQPLDEISETVERQYSNSVVMGEPRHLHVCKKNAIHCDEDKENSPTLSSISYSPEGDANDKSAVVYTVSIPVETNKAENLKPTRYVSSVTLDVARKSKDNEEESHVQSSKITQVGRVKFHVKSKSDLDLAKDERNEFELTENGGSCEDDVLMNKSDLDLNQNYHRGGIHNLNDLKGSVLPYKVKLEVLEKKRHKEELINANSHTADWLLNSQKHLQTGTRSSMMSPNRVGKPVWASTPNLKMKRNTSQYDDSSRRIKKEGNHSFDLLLQEEPGTNDDKTFTGNHFGPAHSVDELDSRQHLTEMETRLRLSDLRGDSACSSMDESVDISRPSLIGNSYSMPEDDLNYLRLVRLVNGPSHTMDISKMPNAKFTPNFHMKNWTQLSKRKHLEEETLLMQHAVQRYKTELCLMENMLFALYRTAQEELEPEDREEVEELQHLWCEVKKEVIKMDELLGDRLRAIMAGNNTYSPLDGLEIIQSMIDLLREQLYHQQMSMSRDISFTEDLEIDQSHCQSALSGTSSVSETWMSDISSQVSDIKSSLESAEQKHAKELQDRISELKKSLLSEVKNEMTMLSEVKNEMKTTQNAKMLQLQLQARDNEIRRLKMELLLQNVNSGGTRKRHLLESDV